MREVPFLKIYSQPTLSYTYIGYNLKNPLFQDKRVRQALTYATNREEIVQYVLYGLGTVATGPFPNHLWYANPKVKPFPYDPKKPVNFWLRQDGRIQMGMVFWIKTETFSV